jgi:hypothetical protein
VAGKRYFTCREDHGVMLPQRANKARLLSSLGLVLPKGEVRRDEYSVTAPERDWKEFLDLSLTILLTFRNCLNQNKPGLRHATRAAHALRVGVRGWRSDRC